MNFRGKLLDPGNGFFDFLADFRCWRERGIPQPIMADHAIFVRIGNRAFFQRGHVGQRLLHARFHRGEEFVDHVHPAQVHRQTEFGKFGVIFLKPFPPLPVLNNS